VTCLSGEDVGELTHQLSEQGYHVLRGLLPRAPLTDLANELFDAYARFDKFEGAGMIAGHLNCFPGERSRFVYEELTDVGVIDAIKKLRAGRSSAMRATTNFNLPGSVAQHYHMDGLYTEDFLICNVALVDIDLVNGAIDVLPGTNREFLPFWRYAVQRTYRRSTRLEMNVGDVLVRKSNLWHRGMPNKSDRPRPMMSITFGETSGTEADPFVGETTFYGNWFNNTSKLGVLRERVVVAVPSTYSAFRFVKSLTGRRGYESY
jgi:hypothetical protein